MLILSRRESESVHLGDDVKLTIVKVSGEKVRLGIDAPANVKVIRSELEITKSGDESSSLSSSLTLAGANSDSSATSTKDSKGPNKSDLPRTIPVPVLQVNKRRAA